MGLVLEPAIFNGHSVYTTAQAMEILGITKEALKYHRHKLYEGVHFFEANKSDIASLKKRTAGTPLGEVYKRMYTSRAFLITQEGIDLIKERLGKRGRQFVSKPIERHEENKALKIVKVEDIGINEGYVDGRRLHAFLQIESNYTTWFDRMCEYGFTEGKDFFPKMEESMGRPLITHDLTMDMAKEISMLQRTERGKQARQYFIECEKKLKQAVVPSYAIDDPIARAKAWIAEQEAKMKLQTQNEGHLKAIEAMKPKVQFADAIIASIGDILIRDFAKVLKQNGVDIGEKRLYRTLRETGYLIKAEGSSHNMPTQRAMEMNLFKIKEGYYVNPYTGENQLTKTPMITGKGQAYFLKKFLGN